MNLRRNHGNVAGRGVKVEAPVTATSFVLRVTKVKLKCSAVAASKPSITDSHAFAVTPWP
jgi:hypothetical protein